MDPESLQKLAMAIMGQSLSLSNLDNASINSEAISWVADQYPQTLTSSLTPEWSAILSERRNSSLEQLVSCGTSYGRHLAVVVPVSASCSQISVHSQPLCD